MVDAMDTIFHTDDTLTEDIRAIHEALGAVSAAEPMACCVYPGADGEWRVRCNGDCDERHFPSRERAVTAAQVSVARCTSYCLCVRDPDGRVTRGQLNWQPRRDVH
ncbi:MAG: hypothetical protein C0484_26465 [Rhodospirillum sp.]|jgi:hypothetical protein|nr:hypothetical protein [Rhodospirillum sp.]